MKQYFKMHSAAAPAAIEVTGDSVLVAKNVTPYEEEIDGRIIAGYEYDCEKYDKDEYLVKLTNDNNDLQQQLLDTQLMLTEIYEGGSLQ